MCGIYGYIGEPAKDTAKIIKTLGILNQARGKDSTGVAIITPGKVALTKQAVNAKRFFKENYKGIRAEINAHPFVNIIGHTRAATSGKVIQKNAHPFIESNIVFAHNGIIYNFDELKKESGTHFAVDSQIIGYYLARDNEKNVFNKKLNGWFTVPFARLDNPMILKVATHISPFSFAPVAHGVYYSSESTHLKSALKGHKTKAIVSSKSEVYRFKFEGGKVTWETKVLTPKSYTQYYYGSWSSDEDWRDYYTNLGLGSGQTNALTKVYS